MFNTTYAIIGLAIGSFMGYVWDHPKYTAAPAYLMIAAVLFILISGEHGLKWAFVAFIEVLFGLLAGLWVAENQNKD